MGIAVTGLGVVSALGFGTEANLHGLWQERMPIAPVSKLAATHLRFPVAEVPASNRQLSERAALRFHPNVPRTALLGLIACQEAIRDAGVAPAGERIGLVLGTTTGGMDITERHFTLNGRADERRGYWLRYHGCGDVTAWIANQLGIGYCDTVSTACSSGANAIMLGAILLEQHRLDTVVCGGTDALCRFTLNGFNSLGLVSSEPCKPFDANLCGLTLGEGAGFIVIRRSGGVQGKTYPKLCGWGNANDAYHQTGTSPEGRGARMAMEAALRKAGIEPNEIGYINAHGTATPTNDASEVAAMLAVFGEKIPPFSSTKGQTGHTLGAAGGIEAVFTVKALQQGYRYRNTGFSVPMPEVDLRPITQQACGCKYSYAMSNSFGFGGNCTSLIFSMEG